MRTQNLLVAWWYCTVNYCGPAGEDGSADGHNYVGNNYIGTGVDGSGIDRAYIFMAQGA